ncbi:MAG: cation transporting ATPase C-terminal domain-containing protein [archaeon]
MVKWHSLSEDDTIEKMNSSKSGLDSKEAAERLKVYDPNLLEVGDKVPADARIIEQSNLHLDEAMLTGESVPVCKTAKAINKENAILVERKNIAHMGTVVTNGCCEAVVIGTGMKTEMGKIAKLIQDVEEMQTPLQVKLRDLGKQLGIIILGICAVVFFSNKFLLLAIAVSPIGQILILYVPMFQLAFHTMAMGLYDWLLIIAVASTGFIYLEAYKAISLRRK